MPATVTLPIFTRVNGVEVDLGTVEVPVDVHALLAAEAPAGTPTQYVTDFDDPPGTVEGSGPAGGSMTCPILGVHPSHVVQDFGA